MTLFKKFISETPRWVSGIQAILVAFTSIVGTLTAAGVVINPAIGAGVAVVGGVAVVALQTITKVEEVLNK